MHLPTRKRFSDISFNRNLEFVTELSKSGEFVWKSSSVPSLELFSLRSCVLEKHVDPYRYTPCWIHQPNSRFVDYVKVNNGFR